MDNGAGYRICTANRLCFTVILDQGWLSARRTILAEAAIASAEALPPLEGEAAFQRKYLIARALSTLIAVCNEPGG